jgi:hypothetical protein
MEIFVFAVVKLDILFTVFPNLVSALATGVALVIVMVFFDVTLDDGVFLTVMGVFFAQITIEWQKPPKIKAKKIDCFR